jgi:hypothetical protein
MLPEVPMPAAYNIRVRIRWWVMPYLRICRRAALCGIPVDLGRVQSRVQRGVSLASRRVGLLLH